MARFMYFMELKDSQQSGKIFLRSMNIMILAAGMQSLRGMKQMHLAQAQTPANPTDLRKQVRKLPEKYRIRA